MKSALPIVGDDGVSRGSMKKHVSLLGKVWLYNGFFLSLILLWSLPAWAQNARPGVSAEELMRGLGIVAVLSALVGLVLIEFIVRRRLRRGTYHWLLFVGLFMLPFLAMTSTTMTLFEETKTVRSCASCHAMDPFVSDLRNPDSHTLAARHSTNKWIPEHQCYTCHTTYGVHGALEAKLSGFRHWWRYMTGTWERPIRYKGSFPNADCLFCHEGTPKFEKETIHKTEAVNLATNRIGCFTCHGPPHPSPEERMRTKESYGKNKGTS